MTCCEANNINCNQGRDCPDRAKLAAQKPGTTESVQTLAWSKFQNDEQDVDPDEPDGLPVGAFEAAAFHLAIVFFTRASFALVIGLFGYFSVTFAKVLL